MTNLELLQKEAREKFREYLSHFFTENAMEKHITIGEDRYAQNRFNDFSEEIVAHVYKQAIEDAIGVLPEEATNPDFGPWNACLYKTQKALKALLPTTNPPTDI